MMRLARLLVIVAWTASACSGSTGTFLLYEDTGTACVCGGEQGACTAGVQRFELDRPVRIGFALTDVCLSSSCDVGRDAACTVTRDGSTLHVTTSASYTDRARVEKVCTADCGMLSATCSTEPLPAGGYTVMFGAQRLSFEVPSEAYSYCVRN